jgi:hypothetical protein
MAAPLIVKLHGGEGFFVLVYGGVVALSLALQPGCRSHTGFPPGSQYDCPGGLGILKGVMVREGVSDEAANNRKAVPF